jgi:cytochrome c peroxidase
VGQIAFAKRFGLLIRSTSRFILIAALLATNAGLAWADDEAGAAAATAGEVAHKQKMRKVFPDPIVSGQPTPNVISQQEMDGDPGGIIATYQPSGSTQTGKNAFFQDLGSNGRTCFTCHQPQDGWTISAEHAQARFDADPNDPLFRLVDGATCPSADVSTVDAKRAAYSLLTTKGLIRIGLPMPATMEFQILEVSDPYGCSTNPITGLTDPRSGIVSFYRRPLPSANLGFLSTIMWDGREPDLFHQSVDATLGHAQSDAAPSPTQQQQIVTFEGGMFTAQLHDDTAAELTAAGATGGPQALATSVTKFYIGINDPLGLNPTGAAFSPVIFHLYDAWSNLSGGGGTVAARSAIARGQRLFNSVPINITGVGGLNDVLNRSTVNGFCGTCHDTPDAGDHSVKAPLNIGIANAGTESPPVLDITGLPVFTLSCAGKMLEVTDIGRAMISGKCADIGKFKGPVLRGLAARAPYFHNGSAATLFDVVEFYDQRFGIGLTAQQKADLVAFLNAL